MKITLQKGPHGLIPTTIKGKRWYAGLEIGAVVEAKLPEEVAGTVPMLRTWMKWMAETAQAMSARGCKMPLYIDSSGKHHGERAFCQDDAHALFTSTYLGVDESGKRKSWSLSSADDEVQASMGDRLHAMDTHVQWCLERGIKLTIPRNSEYQSYRQEQECAA